MGFITNAEQKLTNTSQACRLEDVVHSNNKLYLVFEYLDLDLKKHMDSHPAFGSDHMLVKVCVSTSEKT